MRTHRRRFLQSALAAAAGPLVPGIDVLAPLSRLAAADTRIDPARVRLEPGIARVIELIRSTPRERCIPVMIEQLQAGLSYHEFLAALFLATLEHGDPHQVAGVYAAHRLSSEARPEERLLPLFWSLDRIAGGFEEEDFQPRPPALTGPLPGAAGAEERLDDAMRALDPDAAERAIAALARARGNRRAMATLWEHGARRVHGTLGHHPIMAASTWRTLEALGWQHADPVLRYVARSFARLEADASYAPNVERARQARSALAADWATSEPDRGATLELFGLLRTGETETACERVSALLRSGVKAGAIWDAVYLVAADLLVRYRSGGSVIGGYLIHAVTSTNALRCGFDSSGDDRVRLVLLLQAVAVLGNLFVGVGKSEKQLRDRSLLDLRREDAPAAGDIAAVFAMLPRKANVPWSEEPDGVRQMSDEACRTAFALLRTPVAQSAFERAARTVLCARATPNAHDLKYPVAAFEDAARVSPEWRPHLLAASLHALHGTASEEAPVLVRARDALR